MVFYLAPVMLLELCDMSLKDWLQDNEKMTPEVMENMLNFTRNIAQGVQHLHSQDVRMTVLQNMNSF